MVEVKWTDFAIQNLNEIGDYIEKKGAPLIEMRESGEAKLLTQREEE